MFVPVALVAFGQLVFGLNFPQKLVRTHLALNSDYVEVIHIGFGIARELEMLEPFDLPSPINPVRKEGETKAVDDVQQAELPPARVERRPVLDDLRELFSNSWLPHLPCLFVGEVRLQRHCAKGVKTLKEPEKRHLGLLNILKQDAKVDI